MDIIFVICVYALFLMLIVMLRSAMKSQNPRYCLLDDFLFFTGSPLCFGCMLFRDFFPYPALYDTLLVKFVWAWFIISNIILIVRFQKNHKKTEKKEVKND